MQHLMQEVWFHAGLLCCGGASARSFAKGGHGWQNTGCMSQAYEQIDMSTIQVT